MMKYDVNDNVRVVYINYEHKNRQQVPFQGVKGMKGKIYKKSVTEQAYFVRLYSGHQVFLYEDEIELI